MPDLDEPVLANVVWHALAGPHAEFRQGGGGATRYDPDVAVFAAVPDEPSAGDWDDLAELVGRGGAATLFRESVTPPDGWKSVMDLAAVQMVATSVDLVRDAEAVALGPDDVEEMLELVAATDPGPFGPRTVELGFVHTRDIVAMSLVPPA